MSDFQITGFEMLSKLGEGGMASVWKARQVSLDRIVAIKILASHLASDPDDLNRFRQESQSAAKLKHPGIVQVYDANFENGIYFFVMEFVAGYTCADWLGRVGKLSESDVLLIADCVADALGHAWDRERMVHCDIKPDNIMIDDDGSVKVTDLGLARTISSMKSEASEDILGTPAYMAPEQAAGEVGLDCRTDMYSLGAMMYHMATGQMLFEGCEPEAVVTRQIEDYVPNPRDLEPSLSKGFCRLVEVLLAKRQEGRPESWEQVRDAIRQIRKGLIPQLKCPDGIPSTARPGQTAESVIAHRPATPTSLSRKLTREEKGFRTPLIVLLLFVTVVGLFTFWMQANKQTPASRIMPVAGSEQPPQAVTPPASDRARVLYHRAADWEARYPTQLDQVIIKYEAVLAADAASPYADRARHAITRLQARKRDEATAALADLLRKESDALVSNHDFDAAIRVYADYSGEWAAETETLRTARVVALKQAQAEWLERERVRLDEERQETYEVLLDDVAELCVEGDFSSAVLQVESALDDELLATHTPALRELAELLLHANQTDRRIIESFVQQKGQHVTVELKSGSKTLLINGVSGSFVSATMVFEIRGGTASRSANFSLSELTVNERIRRMGPPTADYVNLVKGAMAYEMKSLEHAKRFFAEAGALLAPRLIARIEVEEVRVANEQMSQALREAITNAGIGLPGAFVGAEWIDQLKRTPLSAAQVDMLQQAALQFQRDYAQQAGYASFADVVTAILALQPVPNDPVAPPPHRPLPEVDLPDDIARLVGHPAAFMERLLTDNPGMGSEDVQMRQGDEGHVIRIRIRSHAVKDIRALAACRHLRELEIRSGSSRETMPLHDLSPLRGLPLESLSVDGSNVDDLTNLKDLPIRSLAITRSNLRDLSPLQDMPLTSLDVSGTKVYDFKPIAMLPITAFAANDSQVRDLGFMRQWQLQALELSDTSVYSFAALSLQPLKRLVVANTQLRDLDVLRNCPLEELDISGSDVSDLDPLKAHATTLKRLALNNLSVREWAVLRLLNLSELSLENTKFADMALIAHMQLTQLNLNNTPVDTLTGLDPRLLVRLMIEGTRISSITPLRQARQLRRFDCRNTRIRDFMPIHGLPITHLLIDDPDNKPSLFRQLPELEQVNWRPWFR